MNTDKKKKIRKVACEIFKKNCGANWANWKIEITKTEKYRRVVALRAIWKKSHSKFMSQLPKKKAAWFEEDYLRFIIV